MQHRIFAIISLCLALTTGAASAQFNPEELMGALLADIGVTELELMQFGAKLDSVAEPYQQFMEENQTEPTRENYVEVSGHYFDHLISPLIDDYKSVAKDSFSDESYAKMMLRFYQVAEIFPEAFQANDVSVSGLLQLFLLPDVVPMTEEQLAELIALQKEVVTEIVGIDTIAREENAELFAEQTALFEELEKAETDEERAAVQEKLSRVMAKTSALMKEPAQKIFAEAKDKLDTLLTDEQKTKLAQIKQGVPDYMQKAITHLKAAIKADEASAAWRPGLNSWMPGQGAPQDRTGHPAEAQPEKTPKERPFPE